VSLEKIIEEFQTYFSSARVAIKAFVQNQDGFK
jgi:hypothetical protein